MWEDIDDVLFPMLEAVSCLWNWCLFGVMLL